VCRRKKQKMVLKTKEQARANLEQSISYIPQRYVDGTAAADWKTPAGSDQAEANFNTEMTKVLSGKIRQKGVQAASNADWQVGCKERGSAVIGERIRGALEDWSREWGPKYDQVVTVVKALKPSTTDFRANIANRLTPTVEAWKRASGKL